MRSMGLQLNVLAVLVLLTGCDGPSDTAAAPTSKECPKSAVELEGAPTAHSRLCAVAHDAERVECEAFVEINGDLWRVGPFLITDKAVIARIADQLTMLKYLKPNVYKGWGDINPHSVRVVFIRQDRFACERIKLYAHSVVVFPDGEPFEGMLNDNTLADIFQHEAEKHFRSHPEDAFKTNR
jgi:hypothetical protein